MIPVTPHLEIDERDLNERFVRASGPGGQNVNKVATAVELRYDVAAANLPADVKERLLALAAGRMTADGRLLIDSREHRTQAKNRDAARDRLVDLVRRASVRPKKRRPTAPSASARQTRLTSKTRRSGLKAGRRQPAGDDD